MFYKLLGMLVWKAGKVVLRRRYGPTYTPKPVLAAGVALLLAGAFLLVNSRRDSSG